MESKVEIDGDYTADLSMTKKDRLNNCNILSKYPNIIVLPLCTKTNG